MPRGIGPHGRSKGSKSASSHQELGKREGNGQKKKVCAQKQSLKDFFDAEILRRVSDNDEHDTRNDVDEGVVNACVPSTNVVNE